MLNEFAVMAASSASVVLAPIFVLQGTQVRKRTPKIPSPAGKPFGVIRNGENSVRLLFLGESTIEGVGAPTYDQTLPGQAAQSVATEAAVTVSWHAVGKRGVTVQKTIQHLLPQLPDERFDMAVIALGVNDVLRFHHPTHFQRDLMSLISQLRFRLGPIPIVLVAVPEVGRFPILPQPLRVGLGLRAHAFNIAMRRMTHLLPMLTLAEAEFIGGIELLCADQFHPSPLGYQQWGQHLGRHIAKLLNETSL